MSKIITEKSNLVSVANAVRAQSGTTASMSFSDMIRAIESLTSGGGVDADSITIGVGEDGLVYAFVDGAPVGVGVAIETLQTPITPTGSFAPGLYYSYHDSENFYDKYIEGDIEGANSMLVRTWDDLINSGDIEVENNTIIRTNRLDQGCDYALVIANGITTIGDTDPEDDVYVEGLYNANQIVEMYIPSSVTYIGPDSLPTMPNRLIIEEGNSPVVFSGECFGVVPSTIILPKNIVFDSSYCSPIFMGDSSDFYSITFNGTVDEWKNAVKDCRLHDADHSIDVICTDGTITVESSWEP